MTLHVLAADTAVADLLRQAARVVELGEVEAAIDATGVALAALERLRDRPPPASPKGRPEVRSEDCTARPRVVPPRPGGVP